MDGRKIVTQVMLVMIAAVALVFAWDAGLSVKYAILHPIRDKAFLQKILKKQTDDPRVKKILRGRNMEMAETLYLPGPTVLRLTALGWNNFFADILFIRAHAYFISHFFYDREFPWLNAYFNAIHALDPMNARVYLWAAQVEKYGQNMNNKTILKANKFLLMGLKYFPNDPRFYQELGFNLYFEYKASNPVDQELMRIRAREYFSRAASLPGSHIDPNFVAQLYSEKADDRLALYYALTRYFESSSSQKRQLLYRISRLKSEMAVNLKRFERRWKSVMPFVDTNLFAVIGDKLRPSDKLLDYLKGEKNHD